MNGSDIHFILPESLRHDVDDNIDVYYTTTYMYGFSFNVSIHTGQDVLTLIVPTFNGVEDDDLVLTQTSDGEYTVTDKSVVRRGNYAYGVKVCTAKGRVYDRFFYLKILNSGVQQLPSFTSLSTYGLHENFSKLRVVAHVNSVDHVDQVKLARRMNGGKLVDVGSMQVNGVVYEYDDLLYDVVDRGGVVEYVATASTSTGATWTRSLTVPFSHSTLSPNTIVTTFNDNMYTVYGGVTCRVVDKLSLMNDQILIITVNADDQQSALTMRTVDNGWSMYAEHLGIVWPKVFNQNVTDASPNEFTFTGNCQVAHVDGESRVTSIGTFTCVLTCGDNVYAKFAVTVDDGELSFNSDVTVNNVVVYGTNDDEVLDTVHDDIYVSTSSTCGFLTLTNNALAFTKTSDFASIPVHTSTAEAYISAADVVAATDEHLYMLNFSRDGITYVKFDGINYDEFVVNVSLNSGTIARLKQGRYTTFDKVNNLVLNFHDGDGLRSLKRVAVVNDKLTVVVLDKRLLAIYHLMEQSTMAHITALKTINYNGIDYEVSFNSGYDVRDEYYDSINFDNSVQKFTTFVATRVMHFTVLLKTTSKPTGLPVTIAASVLVTSTATACVLDANQTVDAVNHNVEFSFSDVKFTVNDAHVDNQNPPNIMEYANDQYYVKFEKSTHSSTATDYGFYRTCSLYCKTIKLCSIPLEAFYGDGCSQKLYNYGDFSQLKVVQLDKYTVMLIKINGSNSLFTTINTSENQRIRTVSIPSTLIFTQLMNIGDKCLGELEHMLTGASQYVSTKRSLYIFSVSDDKRCPSVFGLGSPIVMKRVDNIVSEENESASSWAASTSVDWPLSAKNRNSFLGTIDVKVLDDNL